MVKAYSDTADVTFGVEGMEQTVFITADSLPYQVLPFIADGEEIEKGTFSVKVNGDVAVCEVSLLPTDHFYGMRRDVIRQLRTIAPTAWI